MFAYSSDLKVTFVIIKGQLYFNEKQVVKYVHVLHLWLTITSASELLEIDFMIKMQPLGCYTVYTGSRLDFISKLQICW